MSGANWIVEKVNSPDASHDVEATVFSEDVILVRRSDRLDAHIGIVPISRGDSLPIVDLHLAKYVHAQNPAMTMMIAIPKNARWSGSTMRWLEAQGIAFGGVGDFLSAIHNLYDISVHRNKTYAFVNDGLLRHSRVSDLTWVDSNKVIVTLRNDVTVTVALNDAYDITMDVARKAARLSDDFDVLLKTNPNGSITSNGAEATESLGFKTLKWGQLFGYLARKGGRAGNDDLRERLRRARTAGF